MAEVILESFPFDSMKVLNEQSGKMEGDRRYDARVFREYFRKFLSNGVYFGTYKNYGDKSMKVTLDGGMNIKVTKGCGVIEGADYELENDVVITLDRPATNTRIDRVVVRFDSTLSERNTSIDVKQGNGTTVAMLQRDNNIYEICLAEVTVKSTSNITESDIKDTRLDKNLCGVVSSLITIDGEKIIQNFKDYIDSVTENLVRKDQDSVIEGKITAKGGLEGDLKGDVDGNAKTATNANKANNADYATNAGSASSCTGNAATATSANSAKQCTRKQCYSNNSRNLYRKFCYSN